MAKMFYSLDEAKTTLGKSEDEIKAYAREGRLREFRDGPRLMFKADQVECLKTEISGGEIQDNTGLAADMGLSSYDNRSALFVHPDFSKYDGFESSSKKQTPLERFVIANFTALFSATVIKSLAEDMAEDAQGMEKYGIDVESKDLLEQIHSYVDRLAKIAREAVSHG